MPNIKSAKKRVEVSAQNKQNNKAFKSELATGLKKYNALIGAGDVAAAEKCLPEVVKLIDKSVTRGIIHKNKADRKKADLGTKLVKLQSSKSVKPAKAEDVKPAETEAEEVKPAVKKRATKKAEEVAEEPKKTVRKTAKKEQE